ncbi:MAG: helix-hairpin-helix domain-containing protein [Saprospiraceae bacterium]|nr:helix-hairpin-helix domain-containing protein [Saprospiraceae bacterium]
MKQQIKDYFSFSKSERRGVVVLLLILFLILVINFAMPKIISKQQMDFSEFEKEIAAFEASKYERSIIAENFSTNYKNYSSNYTNYNSYSEKSKLTPFPFNPNEIGSEDWSRIGLNEKKINVILNYLSKGGKFYKKEDLRKIYVITDEEYETLEPFIILPDNLTKNENSNVNYNENFIVELNSAKPEDLQLVRGIGPAFSKRIIAYRDKLGGYSNNNQLMEVFGMDSVRFKQIAPFMHTNDSLINKIPINSASYQNLFYHPYINHEIAFAIVNYRYKHGAFKSDEDLLKLKEVNDSILDKIKPYIEIKNK